MGDTTLWTLLLLQALVLGLAGILGAWLAGRLGTAPMVGALLAGILLGPSVGGELLPETYRSLFPAGHEARAALEAFDDDAREDMARLERTGVTPVAVEARQRELQHERRQLVEQLEQAVEPQQSTLMILAMAGLAFVMLSASRGLTHIGPWRPRLPLALAIAAGSAALAGVTAAALVAMLAWFGRFEADAWRLAGIAIGCAAVATPIPVALLQRPVGHHLDAPLLQLIAWCVSLAILAALAVLAAVSADTGDWLVTIGSVIVLIIVGLSTGPLVDAATERFVTVSSDGARAPLALVGFAVALIILLAIVIVGPTLAALALAAFLAGSTLRRTRHAHATAAGLADRAGQAFFSPMLIALAGVHVHLLLDFDWLLLLVVILAFGDGKALGALLAGRGAHFPWRIGFKSGAALGSGTAMPIAVALLLLLGGVIDGPAFTALTLAAAFAAAFALPAARIIDRAIERDEL